MKKYDKITPEGTRDYLFRECKIRRMVEGKLRNLFESFGYDEVMTTSLEFYDVFSDGVGKVSQNELYTLTDGSGRLITMRPDSTKPIARLFSSRLKEFVLPVKLYYSQPVFRRNIALSRKSDEVLQMGVELIGGAGFKSDLEIVILAIKSMKELFGNGFFIEIGHMGIIGSLLNGLESNRELARVAISQKNFPEIERIAKELGDKGEGLKSISNLFGGKEIIAKAKDIFKKEDFYQAILELEEIYRLLEREGLGDNVLFDLSMLNERQYYTGLVFRGFVEGIGFEVMSGGRYDTLYNDYELNVPAIGFAINLNEGVEKLSKFVGYPNGPETIVLFSEGYYPDKLSEIKGIYLEKGYRCLISLCNSLEETMIWAKAIKAEIVVACGNKGNVKEYKVKS